jgi:hypothetical protein
MKVIDESPYQAPDGTINFWNRIQGSLAYGPSWFRDMQAQQEIIAHMARTLDNRFVLLRNIVLPGTDIPIPLILVGPTGVWVMIASGMRGVFRAKGDSWMSMEGGRFKAAKPNMLTRTMLMRHAIDAHLQKESLQVSEIRPVILFTNPGMHVDSVHPSIRVVLSDALDRYVASMLQEVGGLSSEKAQQVVSSLSSAQAAQREEKPVDAYKEEDDIFAFRESADDHTEELDEKSVGGAFPGASYFERLNISGKQWTALGIVFGLWILLLLAFAVVVLIF